MNDPYAAMTLGAIGPHGGVPDPVTHLLPNPFT